MYQEESSWPVEPVGQSVEDDNSTLEIKTYIVTHCKDEKSPCGKLLQYYSSWHRMKKGVSWLLQFKKYLKSRSDSKVCSKLLTVANMDNAEKSIIKLLQEESFP